MDPSSSQQTSWRRSSAPEESVRAVSLYALPLPTAPDAFPAIRGIDVVDAADRMLGDRGLFYLALRMLRDEFGDVVARLRVDAANGERGSAAARLHKLAGLAGNASARTIAALARDLEARYGAAPAADEECRLAELEAAIAEVITDLPADIDTA